LMDDLLQFARLGRTEIARSAIDISAIATDVAAIIQSRYTPGARITIEPGMMVNADPILFRMVLENLIDNAFKYASAHRPLEIQVQIEGTDMGPSICVSDNGIGFDAQYAHKLFQPFERLHRQDDYPGTGIGLANAKRIVERHGGLVWAEGAPDRGSKFCIVLPGMAGDSV
jgi:two-component system, chemotaxis family, sensor kinase Cph1